MRELQYIHPLGPSVKNVPIRPPNMTLLCLLLHTDVSLRTAIPSNASKVPDKYVSAFEGILGLEAPLTVWSTGRSTDWESPLRRNLRRRSNRRRRRRTEV